MRFACGVVVILIACSFAVAQQPETNFSVGPQYLITQPYPTILQPIATPSYSPWQQTGVVSPQTGEAGPVLITIPAYLPSVYWGYEPPGSVQIVAEPEPTPAPKNLPPDYIDVGVSAVATPGWLNEHDYGMSLVEAARYWKAQHLHATHVYTNQDIDRLDGK
jgi:hypothetical protein